MSTELLAKTKIEEIESTVDMAKDLLEIVMFYCDECNDDINLSKVYSALEITLEKLNEALNLTTHCKNVLME